MKEPAERHAQFRSLSAAQSAEQVNQIQKTVIDPLKNFATFLCWKADRVCLPVGVHSPDSSLSSCYQTVTLAAAREELRPVREDFEAKNKQLLEEMPRFYHSRIDFFQPSFEALIRAQVVYYTEMYKIFGELTDQIDQSGLTDEQRERENEAKLNELRALSIVADD
ncbi:UNVERIFIED_CONTAM: hypothetical protein FKN15_015653 [Acipenser sinensis]